uniref:Uncharacterized protein MANES_06G085400 n=1 Tax=Rhizophora mucronata TaxID=61149 RepID=A0A2P2M979_RHIMU
MLETALEDDLSPEIGFVDVEWFPEGTCQAR